MTGLRPTFGRVIRHGAMALSWSLNKIGPIGRSVEDCALVFNAIHGADGADGTTVSRPFLWEPAEAFDELTRQDQDDLLVRQGKDAWPNVFGEARLIPAVEHIQTNGLAP